MTTECKHDELSDHERCLNCGDKIPKRKKSYPEICLERVSRPTPGPWRFNGIGIDAAVSKNLYVYVDFLSPENAEFVAASREMVPELANRLKKACDSLVVLKGVLERKMPVHPDWVQELVDELEAMPELKLCNGSLKTRT